MNARHTLCAALLTALAGLAAPYDASADVKQAAARPQDASAKAVGRTLYYVRHDQGRRDDVELELRGHGAEITYYLDRLRTFVVALPEPAVATMSASRNVSRLERVPEPRLAAQVVPWNIDQFQARDVWDKNRDGVVDLGAPTGAGITICIIDTGFQRSHSDHQGIVVNGTTEGTGMGNWFEDGNGHGTHVAGTINAVNNTRGVVGVLPGAAELYIVKVFQDDGDWGGGSLAAAANKCRLGGADVISMSLGGSPSQTEEDMFQDLYDTYGILNVAAAGNDGNDVPSAPAMYESVVMVGAINEQEVAAEFSQTPFTAYDPNTPPANLHWDMVEFAGGGVQVLSTVPTPNGEVPIYRATFNGVDYNGSRVAADAPEFTPEGNINGVVVNGGRCLPADPAQTWTGNIVLCERGDASFAEKVNKVRAQGGAAVVIFNNVPGDLGATCGPDCVQPSIPALALSQERGQALLATAVGQSANVTIDDGSPCVGCNGGYDFYSGTSMATPGVSAAMSFVWNACGGPSQITNKQLRQLLRDSARDLSGIQPADTTPPPDGPGEAPTQTIAYGTGWDRVTGWGLVQLADALQLGNERFGSDCPLALTVTPIQSNVCKLSTTSTTIDLALDDQFAGTSTLSVTGVPAGASGSFSVNPVVSPANASVYTLSNLGAVADGEHRLAFRAVDSGNANNLGTASVTLSVASALPGSFALSAPANAAEGVSTLPTLSWTAAAGASEYLVQVASDAAFNTIVESATVSGTSHTLSAMLADNTQYFWRVTPLNVCGGAAPAVASFRTQQMFCATPNAAIPDGENAGGAGVSSTINVPLSGNVSDVDVAVMVSHDWVGDLEARLTHGAVSNRMLIDRPGRVNSGDGCDGDDIDATLDDEAATTVESTCGTGTPSISGTFRPNQTLAVFDGASVNGNWTLNLRDRAAPDAGIFEAWCVIPRIAGAAANVAPVFQGEPYAYTVAQAAAGGTAVGSVNATDANAGQTLSYALSSGNTGGAFAINAATGAITVATPAAVTPANSPFTLGVNVSDGVSGTDATVVTVTVTPSGGNNPPTVANAIADQSSAENDVVSLSLAGTFSDPDGNPLTLSLTAGSLPPGLSLVGNAITGTLTFASAGTYNGITITANDGAGGTVSDTFNWIVSDTNRAPTVANAIADQSSAENDAINLSLASTFADADGNPLTLSLTAGSMPPGLSLVGNAITGTPTFASAGTYNGITITANDGAGGTVSDTFNWIVSDTNRAPTVANAIADQSSAEIDAINLSLASTFADADGNPLTLSLTAGSMPPGLSLVGNAITGTLTFASAGTYNGITITANDGNGGTVSDTFNWTVSDTNRAPTVANAIANQSDVEGEVINLSLAAVFADADGDSLALTLSSGTLPPGLSLAGTAITGTLSLASAGSYPNIVIQASDGKGGTITDSFDWTVSATNQTPTVANAIADQSDAEGEGVNLNLANVFADADGDTLSLSITAGSLPPGLSLVGNAITGTLTFASAGSYNGITITANDGNGGTISDTFDWTVTGTNQSPTVANAIADQSDAEGEVVNLNLANVFADADGDTLSLSLTAGSLPPGLSLVGNAITGTLTFASAGNYNGITITANDGNGGTISDTFDWTVTGTNQSPTVANAIADQSDAEGEVVNLNLANVFADADGDTLSLSLTAGSLPAGLSLVGNAITGTLTFASAGSYNGITITANDGNGGTISDTFDWTVTGTNQSPTVANAIADQSDAEGEVLNLNLANVFADADGNTLTLSITGGSLPAGLSLVGNAITGTLTFASAGSYNGITITANDGNGGTVSDTFDWTVANTNQVPAFTGEPYAYIVTEGAAVGTSIGTLTASDADAGAVLSFAIAGGNTGGAFALNASTGAITVATPAAVTVGTFTLQVSVSDGTDTDTATVTIDVQGGGPQPTLIFRNGFEG